MNNKSPDYKKMNEKAMQNISAEQMRKLLNGYIDDDLTSEDEEFLKPNLKATDKKVKPKNNKKKATNIYEGMTLEEFFNSDLTIEDICRGNGKKGRKQRPHKEIAEQGVLGDYLGEIDVFFERIEEPPKAKSGKKALKPCNKNGKKVKAIKSPRDEGVVQISVFDANGNLLVPEAFLNR